MTRHESNAPLTIHSSYNRIKDEHQSIAAKNGCKWPPTSGSSKMCKIKVEPGVTLVEPYGIVISKFGGKLEITRKMKLSPCYPISFARKIELPIAYREEPPTPKNFECIYCFRSYQRKHSLIRHLRAHNTKNRLKCDYCTKVF